MNILNKIEELEVLINKITQFPDDMFESNVLSPKEIKQSFNDQFLYLKNKINESLSEANEQIELCAKELGNLKQGKPVRAFAFF